MLNAALEGVLDDVEYTEDPVFGLAAPTSIPGVPDDLLAPRSAWSDKDAFDEHASRLAGLFIANFATYSAGVGQDVAGSGPRLQ
jgi:phosphoenolpyruvate carboxykinase (ATP)